MSNEQSEDVIFRRFRDGEILALFPNIPAGHNAGMGGIASYLHVGQHGAADYKRAMGYTVPAKPDEYAELKAELEGLGYKLNVRKRRR